MKNTSVYNILLVDDSPNILKALKRTFANEGYNLHTAESAREAMEIIKSQKIDLVIVDENMPETSGSELLSALRTFNPEIVRIMVSGMNDVNVLKNAVNKGEIYRFFNKPWDDFELLISVRYALETKSEREMCKKLKDTLKHQNEMIRQLEKDHPGIAGKNLSIDGAFILDD